MNRKQYTALAFALVGAAALSAQAVAAKDLTVAVYSAFTTLDPYDASDTLSQNVAKSFYEGLFGFDKDMKLVNVLAESYDVSKDGLEYTIKLKQGIKFSDGEPFNAAAVKANFDRVTNPENHLTRYQLYRNIESVEVVDDATVKFHLKEAFSAFINQLAHPSGVMICPKTLALPKKEVAFNPCGTGPYVLEKYNPAEYLVVKKNPSYWQKGLPKLDSISFRPVLEDATRVAMLRTGEAQFVDVVPPEHVERLKETPNIVVDAAPSIVQRQIYLNNTKKPFNDLRVRQALNYGLDKHAMVKVLYKGFSAPATGVAPEGIDYAKQFGEWPYDPKKAKELLTAAGYPNGFTALFGQQAIRAPTKRCSSSCSSSMPALGLSCRFVRLRPDSASRSCSLWGPKRAPHRCSAGDGRHLPESSIGCFGPCLPPRASRPPIPTTPITAIRSSTACSRPR